MGLVSQAASAWVTRHFVTDFSKTCNKIILHFFPLLFRDLLERMGFQGHQEAQVQMETQARTDPPDQEASKEIR